MQIRHKKSLGQNFLKDRLILERIVDSSEINPTDDVYEIGPGDGALTEFIFQKVNSITAYEIDRSLVPILNKRFSEKNLEIININFLNANLEEISNNNSVIVGNLPYNVSSQIILKILESKITFKHCIFMVQKEMANRFILNQEKASKGDTVLATSTRLFKGRVVEDSSKKKGESLLASTPVVVLSAILGRTPSLEEYTTAVEGINLTKFSPPKMTPKDTLSVHF